MERRPLAGLEAEPAGSFASLTEDSDRNVWICTYESGLLQVSPDGPIHRWTETNGLSYRDVRFVFEDRERNLWVGSSGGGLMRFKPRRFRVFGHEPPGDAPRMVTSSPRPPTAASGSPPSARASSTSAPKAAPAATARPGGWNPIPASSRRPSSIDGPAPGWRSTTTDCTFSMPGRTPPPEGADQRTPDPGTVRGLGGTRLDLRGIRHLRPRRRGGTPLRIRPRECPTEV